MTDLAVAPAKVRNPASAVRTQKRQLRPAAASRILVTGFSVAATLVLAAAMAQPASATPVSITTPAFEQDLAVPEAITFTAADQPAVASSHAS